MTATILSAWAALLVGFIAGAWWAGLVRRQYRAPKVLASVWCYRLADGGYVAFPRVPGDKGDGVGDHEACPNRVAAEIVAASDIESEPS